MFRAQLCIAFTITSAFFFGWQSIDESIRARRDFCEYQNNLDPKGDVFLSVEGTLGDTLRIVTLDWDPDNVRAGTVIHEALISDRAIHQELLTQGFCFVSNGSHIYKIPPMSKAVKIYPKKKTAPEVNPYPVKELA